MTEPRQLITFSRYIALLAGVDKLLGADRVIKRSAVSGRHPGDAETWVVGWGLQPPSVKGLRFASMHQLPYLTLEDGFLRSVDLGVKRSPTYSIVIDDAGTHYDATRPSRLENILNGLSVSPLPLDPVDHDPQALLEDAAFLQRARSAIDSIVAAKLSKYNVSPEIDLPARQTTRVLVVDQTAGDFAIRYGHASAESFRLMLQAAREENPHAEILIKTHPDVLTGHKRAHFGPGDRDERTHFLADDINPIHLLQQVDKVYVVTSQLGFEALLVGVPVSCFGAPFYAGWGLTDDRCPIVRRVRKRSIEQVFAAAYMIYARYLDPDSAAPCEIERVIAHLSLQRQWFHRNAGDWVCFGYRWQERQAIRDYLFSPWNTVQFRRRMKDGAEHASTGERRWLIRSGRYSSPLLHKARQSGIPIHHLSRSFLCLPSPASFLLPPASLIIGADNGTDRSWPHDSLAERIADCRLDASQTARAQQIRNQWLDTCSTLTRMQAPAKRLNVLAQPGQRIILVVGTSTYAGGFKCDADIIAKARVEKPDAHILYSPGSWMQYAYAVFSGFTRGAQTIKAHTLNEALGVADEVHTLDSGLGVDALLRHRRLVTYGAPFYAGWGLTDDRGMETPRTRAASLDELTHVCVIEYPRYLNDDSGQFTTPEAMLERLRSRPRTIIWGFIPARHARLIDAHATRLTRKVRSLFSSH